MYFPFGTDERTFHLVAVRIENSSIHLPILHKSIKFERTLVTSSFVSIITLLKEVGRLLEFSLRFIFTKVQKTSRIKEYWKTCGLLIRHKYLQKIEDSTT